MYDFASQANIIIQGCIGAILIGIFYNVWSTTKIYGGIIGTAVRLFGFGMLFVTVSVIERTLINFNIIESNLSLSLAQDAMNVVGLILLAVGFSKLSSVQKS